MWTSPMKKDWLAHQCARLTVIVGCMTNFGTKCTRFAGKTSSVELYYLFLKEYKRDELIKRWENLLDELDTETHDVVVLHENVKVNGS